MEANKTTAIFGNNGLQTATNLPDLSSLIDDNQIKINKNISAFNVWQPTVLEDTIYETERQTEIPSATTGNFAFKNEYITIFDFTLMGYTCLKNIILQWGLTLEATSASGVSNLGTGMPLPSLMAQGEYTWLDILDSIDIKIGKNKFSLTNQEMHRTLGIKQIVNSTKKTPTEERIMSQFGLNASRSAGLIHWRTKDFNAFFQPYNMLPSDTNNAQKGSLFSTDSNCNLYDHYFGNVASANVAEPTSAVTGITKLFALPLSMVNTFFNQPDTYLPKGLNINIRIVWKNTKTVHLGGDSINSFITTSPVVAKCSAVYIKHTDLVYSDYGFVKNACKILYDYSILKEDSDDALRKLWITKPFVYNFYEWKRYVVPQIKSTTDGNVILDFHQNSQRPLDIWFTCVNMGDGTPTSNIANLNGSNQSGFVTSYRFGQCANHIWKKINIFINGRLVKENFYEDVNSSLFFANQKRYMNCLTSNDVLNAIEYSNCDKEKLNYELNTVGQTFQFDNISPYHIILSPSTFFQRGTYPVDQGAVNVRIEMQIACLGDTGTVVANPNRNFLNGVAQIIVYSRQSAQLTLDSSHSVTEVQWPAIISNNTNILTRTINTN